MELSAKYAYKTYEKKSFSSAAKELFISQPALSAAISRLEAELGFKIFDRTTVPLSLTPQGRIYIESLEEIMESETIMKERIKKLSESSYNRLSVGGSCLAAYHILPFICAEFQKKYPSVSMQIDMGNVGTYPNLKDSKRKRSIDILVGHRFPHEQYKITPILEETYIIAMRKDYPGAHKIMKHSVTLDEIINKSYPEDKKIEDMSIFSHIKFFGMSKPSTPAIKMEKLLGNYQTVNCTVRNVLHSGMKFNLMQRGLGAIMTSDTIVKIHKDKSKDLIFFVPKSEEAKQYIYIAQDVSFEPSDASRNFMELAVEICQKGRIFE